MKINIKKEDIFDYAIGNSNYDAIEKIVDPVRFEIFDCGIYDNKIKKLIPQSEEYETYCAKVSALRKEAKNMERDLIVRACAEIYEIAPKEIDLGE